MPSGQSRRSRRYEASAAQHSSIDEPTISSGSPPSGRPTSMRTGRGSRPVQTRIVTTQVRASATPATVAPEGSTKRLDGVRHDVHGDDADPVGGGRPQLRLLNGFDVTIDGGTVDFTTNTQRLIAFLALRERPQPRSTVAGSLWLDRSERRAAANLRTALWKLGRLGHRLVTSHGNQLALAETVSVDFRDVVRRARDLVQCTGEALLADGDASGEVDMLAADLLPDWDDDWILFERERLRQLRMHAIEALSRQLAQAGRYAEAVDAGLAAVAADNLRESAHRVLIEAYLGEGNVADARRQFELYQSVLWDNLRLSPSADLTHLVGV